MAKTTPEAAKPTNTSEDVKPANKPQQENVLDDVSALPVQTGSKAKVTGDKPVNLTNIETGYVHEGLPAETARKLISKNPNTFQIKE